MRSELTLLNGAKAAIIAHFLAQPMEEHALVCGALARLPNTLPHSLLIFWGDFQGEWSIISLKATHIATLSYERRNMHLQAWGLLLHLRVKTLLLRHLEALGLLNHGAYDNLRYRMLQQQPLLLLSLIASGPQ